MLVASWESDNIDPKKKTLLIHAQMLNLSAKIVIAKDSIRNISFTYHT